MKYDLFKEDTIDLLQHRGWINIFCLMKICNFHPRDGAAAVLSLLRYKKDAGANFIILWITDITKSVCKNIEEFADIIASITGINSHLGEVGFSLIC